MQSIDCCPIRAVNLHVTAHLKKIALLLSAGCTRSLSTTLVSPQMTVKGSLETVMSCYFVMELIVGCRQSFNVQLEEVTNIASFVVICPDLMRHHYVSLQAEKS